MVESAVELRGICKRFGAVVANDGVDLAVRRGEIHGIIGENGAGKSTLMAILHGFQQPDRGEIRVDGRAVTIRDSRAAIGLGIDMVHQHFMLVERFTVLENVMLGREGGTLLRRGAARARTALAELSAAYGLRVDPDAAVGSLPVGTQQRVEILKALYRGARTLILDEPTGVLTPQEVEELFRVLRALRDQGRTVLLITHKLHEVMAITDAVSVMRAGRIVAHLRTAETDAGALGEAMIGRRVAPVARLGIGDAGAVRLEARGLRVRDDAGVVRVKGVNLAVRGGEVVGIAGVAGNGQSELLEALAGMRTAEGEIAVDGRVLDGDVRAFRGAGVAHVPEDRLRTGLLRRESAAANAVLGYQGERTHRGWLGLLSLRRIRAHAARLMRDYDVRPGDPGLRAGLFSGGNQQKLIMAREMDREPGVLLIGQPTRGVDIGGIAAIHARILDCRARGQAVLLVSVELDEILALSDRVLVMSDGVVTGELAGAAATGERLGVLMGAA